MRGRFIDLDTAIRTWTFLFTDIEGSTRLWEQSPHAMRRALADHDRLVREAVQGFGGYIFKSLGDGFCIAFDSVSRAILAAGAAQAALSAHRWPTETPVRVRMALHTGDVEERDRDFFGVPLNVVGRLLSLAHGGQILVSPQTYILSQGSLKDGLRYTGVGKHRLRDVGGAEDVFQLSYTVSAGQAAATASRQDRTNLPPVAGNLIGRQEENRLLRAALSAHRLVTLNGPEGNGKTRLALHVASEVSDDFPDGVWLVNATGLTGADDLAAEMCNAVRIAQSPVDPVNRLAQDLAERRALFVINDLESSTPAKAAIEAVLEACPFVQMVVTCPSSLGLPDEALFRVMPMGLPNASSPEAVKAGDACLLFEERAREQEPSFEIDEGTAAAVSSICRLLDGIPLALELAASRLRTMSLDQIEAKLEDQFRASTVDLSSAFGHGQTLNTLITWTFDLLTEPERKLLARLSVFRGGWTLEAAEQVGVDQEIEVWDVLDLISSLVDKSLVTADREGKTVRFNVHETIRRFAEGVLKASGTEADALRSHFDTMCALAADADSKLDGREADVAITTMEAETENFRAALKFASPLEKLRLCGLLSWYWWDHGRAWEGGSNLRCALTKAQTDSPTGDRAVAEFGLGAVTGDEAMMSEAIRVARDLGDSALEGKLSGRLLSLRAHHAGQPHAS